jgi:hypothetical protein
MLQLNENELVQRFRQPGGAGWVGFVNELLIWGTTDVYSL